MPELIHEFTRQVQNREGSYVAQAWGRRMDDGRWEGWLVFLPIARGFARRTGRETTQANLEALAYWVDRGRKHKVHPAGVVEWGTTPKDFFEKKAAIGRLREIVPVERGVSGRVVKLRLAGDAGEKEIAGELEIRRALGDLKSALFVLDGKKDAGGHLVELSARGGGYGHGIGMCQSGAVGLAHSGASGRFKSSSMAFPT